MKTTMAMMGSVALLFASGSAIAQADDGNGAPAAHVSFTDLDLNSTAGKAELSQRIHVAAERLCSTTGDKSLQAFFGGRSCYKTAVAEGLRQMNTIMASRASGVVLASNTLSISRK